MLELNIIKNSDSRLRIGMQHHYSNPKGFVGRNICYEIKYDGVLYGHIVAGSATKNLPVERWEFFGGKVPLNNIVNNTYFHIEPINGGYPIRWQFVAKVIQQWRLRVPEDWPTKYNGDQVLAFETLVEPPRTGSSYLQDGWIKLPTMTLGYTCKRTAGKGTDSWSGKRVWNTNRDELRPKHILVRRPN